MKSAILLGVLTVLALACVPDAIAEGRPNWLSDVVKKARTEYRIEKRQHDAIRSAIQKHPMGKDLAASPKLDKAITNGLKKAAERQKEIDATPDLKTASPAVFASWTIFEDCGIKPPEED